MPNNPTIVSASLDDKELQASINKMVANFDKGLQDMLDHTNTKVKEINEALKGIGNVNFGATGSNDGAVVKQTKAQNDFTDAVKKSTNEIKRQGKEGEMSFDQIAAALSKARQTVSEFNTKRASGILPSSEDYKRYEQALARIVEYNDKLKVSALGMADANQKWFGKFSSKRIDEMFFPKDSGQLSAMNKYYADLEKNSQQATQSAQRYTEEIRKQAQAIRESAEYKAGKDVFVTTPSGYDAVINIKDRISIEDKLTETYQKHIGQKSELDRIEQTDNNVAKERLGTEVAITNEISKRKKYSAPETQVGYDVTRDRLAQIIATRSNIQRSQVVNWDEQTSSIKTLSAALKQYQDAYTKMSAAERNSPFGKQMIADMQVLERNIQSIRREMSRPIDFEFAKNLPANTLEEISYKTQMLRAYAQGINTETVSGQQELTKVMNIVESLGEKAKNLQKTTKQIQQEANSTKFDKISQMPTDSIKQVGQKIKEVRQYISELKSQPIVDEKNLRRAEALFDRLIKQAQKLNSVQGTDKNVNSALKQQANTLDEISQKMQRLQAIRSHLNIETQKSQIDRINAALAELKKQLDDVLQRNQQMIASNTALGRSWNYMKNRLAFYFTVGASTQFVKNLIEVRSQYEMNERALGILIDSAERGTRIFNELSQMALVSPYTLIELSTAAKQLTAYDVAAKDVVDTTRRLADMAAAVGIPIERLTYALGQIKAYGYLNARDARMFSNAGIPLVKQLAEHYTELEGKMVSTADVYDRIKKKAIDMTDVMQVINKMTDEGGKFFDFQAKMAGTLKVQLANLTLAWNNMLNDIGASEQGTISTGIGLLKDLFLEWKNISKMITNLAIGFGVVKVAQLAYYGVVMGTNKAIALETVLGNRLSKNLRSLASSMNAASISSTALWVGIATFAAAAVVDILRGNEAMKEFNKTLRENAENTYNDLKKFSENYSGLRESLYKTENGKQTPVDINSEEAKKAWEVLREQIELSSHASDEYISKLLSIENVSERLRQGFAMIDSIQAVSAAIKELGDDAIKLERDWSEWWNLGLLPDGTIGNLQDAYMWLSKIEEKYGSVVNARKVASTSRTAEGFDNVFQEEAKEFVENYETELEKFREDLQVTKQSIIDFIELKGWSGDTSKINEAFKTFTDNLILKNQLNPQQAYTLQLEMEEARSKAAKQAQYARVKDLERAYYIEKNKQHKEELAEEYEKEAEIYNNWDNFNGRKKVEWERFTKWLKEQHISETTAMFRNMDAEDIKSLNFQEGKHAEWVKRMVTQYAKEHKMSYDEAFKYLKSWVRSANQWSIFIPMTISTEDSKTVYKQLGEYDKAVDEADAQIARLTTRINELNAKKKKSKEETKELAEAEQELADAQKAKADAEAKGGHGKKEKKDERAANKAAKQAETELQKALKDELSTIEKVRSIYKDLTKEGMSHANAVERATRGWDETVNAINRVLQKNGLQKLDLSKFAGIENPRELVNMLQSQLNTLLKRGAKPAEIKELQTKIQTLNVDAEKYDLTKITKGLNNELGKLKDEYELAVELDANPEMGDMFADMFGINTSMLPRTFGDALDRAQIIINRKLAEMNITTPFDLMEGNIDSFAKSTGLDKDGAVIKELVSAQNAYRDMFKKNITETEKVLDDYIKKYGDYSDKIAEIEAGRLEKLKKLNEAYYTEEMRKRPEYVAKLNAIEQGAKKDKQQVDFDEFKNSRYYTMMFENLDYISTKTIRDMRDRVRDLIDTMNGLTPEQLKTLMSQYEKLEQKLVKRSPFKTLTKDLKEYFATTKERKEANIEFKNAQKEYDAQKKSVAALKEKYEQAKANSHTSQSYLDFLQIEINGENEILKILKEQLEAAQKKADKYNLTKKLAKSEALQVAQVVGQNLQSLGELRDFLQQDLGVELSDELNGLVDGLNKVGQGVNKITSSATSGDIVGVLTGVGQTIYGIYDGIASIFGGGSNEKKITEQIKDSERAVKRLENAYKMLEYAADGAFGAATAGAQQAIKANKELQLAELKRQLMLEQSRDSKDRDEDRIVEIRGQIIDLEHEINDFTKNAVNDLLGISSHGDFFESMINDMINAFKQGEDAMEVFETNWSKMIDNMLTKTIVSQVLGDWVKSLERGADKILEKHTNEQSYAISDLTRHMANLSSMDAGDIDEWLWRNDRATLNKILNQLGEGAAPDNAWDFYRWNDRAWDSGLAQRIADAYKSILNNQLEDLNSDLEKASLGATGELIDYYGQAGNEFKDDYLPQILDKIKENWNFGQDSEKQLSNLQQGIQGITEDTAGALESYMNGVSQQVYLHSDLLTQIRDAVVGLDMDIQVATQAQMLLQLQQSYAVQMAIQGILEGWNNPSGQAVRVELVS